LDILRKKLSPGESQGFAFFAGIFEDILEKVGVLMWCFDGENVVLCVVDVVVKSLFFWR
jgi:hypothetical protein